MAYTDWIVLIALLLFTALPLNLAVRLLGGKSSIIKALLVNLIVAVVNILIEMKFKIHSLFVFFIVLLVIYKYLFDLSWTKAFLAWLLQVVFAVLLVYLVFLVLGIKLFLF